MKIENPLKRKMIKKKHQEPKHHKKFRDAYKRFRDALGALWTRPSLSDRAHAENPVNDLSAVGLYPSFLQEEIDRYGFTNDTFCYPITSRKI